MNFTDRYIKVPVDLYEKSKADMIGYSEETKSGNVLMRICMDEISHYRPSLDDNDELKNTLIHMINGDTFHLALTVKDFEKALNSHDETIKNFSK